MKYVLARYHTHIIIYEDAYELLEQVRAIKPTELIIYGYSLKRIDEQATKGKQPDAEPKIDIKEDDDPQRNKSMTPADRDYW